MTIIPIVIDWVTKGLSKELEDLEIRRWGETIQTTAFFRTARILRKVLETCCNSNPIERPSAKTDVKNSHGVEHENDCYTNCTQCSWNRHKRIGTRTGWFGNNVQLETIQTTALLGSAKILRSVLRDLRWAAVTQTPVKDRQLMQMWKLLQGKSRNQQSHNKRKEQISTQGVYD